MAAFLANLVYRYCFRAGRMGSTIGSAKSILAESVCLLVDSAAEEEAHARLVARLLTEALRVTMRSTPDRPAGEVLIHPALKILMNDKTLSATRAADLIKRLLRSSPKAIQALLTDPILSMAQETALRLRPRSPRSTDPG